MDNSLLLTKKLGILGGGQLGKMLCMAAHSWSLKTFVLDPDESCSAASVCTKFEKGSFQDYDTVYQFGQKVDFITIEIENVNTDALKKLKAEGKIVHPDPDVINIIQDKGRQKEFYKEHNLPTSSFSLWKSKKEIVDALQTGKITVPFVQKSRTAGYDGKGVSVIKNITDLDKLIEGECIVEDLVSIKKELSVIVARNRRGETKSFVPVEMEFNVEANLVELLLCPANIDKELSHKAEKLAIDVINAFGMCGILAVEMFLDASDTILINEVAPRPHNSGHHTIESALTSQYEQLIRSVLNMPLGSTEIILPSVMINLLGESGYTGLAKYEGLDDCLAIEGVKIHVYGKEITKPFRKMGHITILDKDPERAKEKAERIKKTLKIIT